MDERYSSCYLAFVLISSLLSICSALFLTSLWIPTFLKFFFGSTNRLFCIWLCICISHARFIFLGAPWWAGILGFPLPIKCRYYCLANWKFNITIKLKGLVIYGKESGFWTNYLAPFKAVLACLRRSMALV